MPRILITLLIFMALLAGDLRGLVAPIAHAAEPPTAPILRIETGRHTAIIRRIATDASGRWLVTASDDKTLRVSELPSGRLVRTIRPPIGEGNEGKLNSVALSPDGATIACGGWTQFAGSEGGLAKDGVAIYLFNRASGTLLRRITGLPNVIGHLAFSTDGRYLAATLGGNGIRLYRADNWSQTGEDKEYGSNSNSAHFSREGQLVTTSFDGYLRLYDTVSGSLRQLAKVRAPGGSQPSAARFSPDGSKVAVGYDDSSSVLVLSGRDLALLYSPDTSGVEHGDLSSVAWSADGSDLYAGGRVQKLIDSAWKCPIRRWSDAGRGSYSDSAASDNAIMDLAALPDGGLAFGGGGPDFGLLERSGKRTLFVPPSIADYRDNQEKFRISADGATIGFGYESFGASPASFDLNSRNLILGTPAPLPPPITSAPGLEVTGWKNTYEPKLNGTPLKLQQYETSRSLAIAPDNTLILGADWSLRRFDRQGNQLWEVPAPGAVWGVNVAPNGSVAVAAYGDGTIRWHRMSDGRELIAFFPHADKKRWVLWTPEGFFDHSPGGEELIGFHLNRGKDREAEFIPVSRLYKDFYRPDLVTASFEGKDISEYAKAVDINKLLNTKSLPPKVRITTKASSTDKPESEVTAEICDNGGGIGDVTLYLNNMPIAVESGGRGLKVASKERDGQCYNFTRTFTLDNGDNVISIMAYNKNNNIESDRPAVTIKHTSRFTGKPDLHIFTIAVDKYRDGDLHLKYSNADANGVAELLKGKGKGLFRAITRHTLTDGEVTKEKLEETFTTIGKKIRREDMFILFVAGHGITYSKDGAFYFLPVNFRYSQDEDIPKSGVSMNDFKRYLSNIQASKSLLLLDTCNSGSFAEAIASRGIMEKTAINKLTRAVGRHTIVASSKSQVALEGYQGHGAFSYTLLDGIKGKAANQKGEITVNSLVSYVEMTLPELTMKKWGYEQIPQKSLVGEDFAIGAR